MRRSGTETEANPRGASTRAPPRAPASSARGRQAEDRAWHPTHGCVSLATYRLQSSDRWRERWPHMFLFTGEEHAIDLARKRKRGAPGGGSRWWASSTTIRAPAVPARRSRSCGREVEERWPALERDPAGCRQRCVGFVGRQSFGDTGSRVNRPERSPAISQITSGSTTQNWYSSPEARARRSQRRFAAPRRANE